jgi:hypothetical protein
VQALQPRAVRIEAVIDGWNRRISQEQLEREFLLAPDSGSNGPSQWQPVVNGEESRPAEAARWIHQQLNR